MIFRKQTVADNLSESYFITDYQKLNDVWNY